MRVRVTYSGENSGKVPRAIRKFVDDVIKILLEISENDCMDIKHVNVILNEDSRKEEISISNISGVWCYNIQIFVKQNNEVSMSIFLSFICDECENISSLVLDIIISREWWEKFSIPWYILDNKKLSGVIRCGKRVELGFGAALMYSIEDLSCAVDELHRMLMLLCNDADLMKLIKGEVWIEGYGDQFL